MLSANYFLKNLLKAKPNNPHSPPSVHINVLIGSVWANRELIVQLTKREVLGRYRGSTLGIAWSFFNPIIMLVVYTFVFSIVFKTRWPVNGEESQSQFALILFVGMLVFGFFSEVLSVAPSLIISNANFVKKIIFPLELLSIISVGAATFHAFIGLIILLVAFVALHGYLNWTIVFIPLIFLPLAVLALGFSWLFSSLGVYLRDLKQAIGVVITMLMFLSPLFYPVNALPTKFQFWMMINPLTFIIEQMRSVIIFGAPPNWTGISAYLVLAIIFSWASYIWFQKVRKGFADVL